MEVAPRLNLMNWLTGQGLTGASENDLVRGFCERCRAGGLDVSRGLVFIDTLHPIFEGRGFRWNDTETNESDSFEYGSTGEGDAAQTWRRSTFFHMLENGHNEMRIDLADGACFPEAMHEGQEMPVTLCGQIIDHREIERGAIGKIDPHLVMAVFEHVKEGGAAPVFG